MKIQITDINTENATQGQVPAVDGSGKLEWTDAPSGGGISDAPSDGSIYGRKDAEWVEVISGSNISGTTYAIGSRVIKNTTQTVAAGSTTKITYDSVVFDNVSCWDSANNQFLIPAGYSYAIVTLNSISNDTTSNLEVLIRKNDTTVADSGDGSDQFGLQSVTTGLIDVVEGDYFTAHIFGGDARTLNASNLNNFSILLFTEPSGPSGVLYSADELNTMMTGTMNKSLIEVNASPDFTNALYLQGASGQTLSAAFTFTNEVAGQFQMWHRRESENSYDTFTITLDSTNLLTSASGTVPSEYLSLDIEPGSHTLSISYHKDGSGNTGIDGMYLYGIKIPGETVFNVSGVKSLSDLDDVDLTTLPTDGQALSWSETEDKWKAQTITSGDNYPDLVGNEGKVLSVNSTEDGVEWIDFPEGTSGGGSSNVESSEAIAGFFGLYGALGSNDTTAYSAKGTTATVLQDLEVDGIYGMPVLASGQTIRGFVSKINTTTNAIDGEVYYTSVLSYNASNTYYAELVNGAVKFKTGDTLVAGFIRMDGTGTSILTFPGSNTARMAAPVTMLQQQYRWDATTLSDGLVSPSTTSNGTYPVSITGRAVVDGVKYYGKTSAQLVATPQRITARYWRVFAPDGVTSTDNWITIGELKWLDQTGTNLVGSGTPSASSYYDSNWAPSEAFDNLLGSNNGWISGNGRKAYEWLAYDFSTEVTPYSISIGPNTSYPGVLPSMLDIEFSFDGSTWMKVDRINLNTSIGAGNYQDFDVSEYTNPYTFGISVTDYNSQIYKTLPILVQQASLRNDGNLVLPQTPTPGNMLVVVAGGYYGTSLTAYKPSGFSAVALYSSNANNAVAVFTKVATSQDTNTFAMTASDNQQAVMYEFENCSNIVGIGGGAISYTGSTGTIVVPENPFSKNSVTLVAVEHDTAIQLALSGGDSIQDFSAIDGGNHMGAIGRVGGAGGTYSVTASGSFTAPVWGAFAVQGKQTSYNINEVVALPSGGTTGQVLAKNSANFGDVAWVNQTGGSGAGATALAELTDVDVETALPTDGQALIWSEDDQLWIPGSVASGGGSNIESDPTAIYAMPGGMASGSASGTASNGKGSRFIPLADGKMTGIIGWVSNGTVGASYIGQLVTMSGTTITSVVATTSSAYVTTTTGNQMIPVMFDQPVEYTAGQEYGVILIRSDTINTTGVVAYYLGNPLPWSVVPSAVFSTGFRVTTVESSGTVTNYEGTYQIGFITDANSSVTNNSGSQVASVRWRNIDSTTIDILDQVNVSSVEKLATGKYQINFTTPYENNHFTVFGNAVFNSDGTDTNKGEVFRDRASVPTVSSVVVYVTASGTLIDIGGETSDISVIVLDLGKPLGGSSSTGGSSLPIGGTTGQILAKESDADGDAVWIDPPVSDGQSGSTVIADSTYYPGVPALSEFTSASSGDGVWAESADNKGFTYIATTGFSYIAKAAPTAPYRIVTKIDLNSQTDQARASIGFMASSTSKCIKAIWNAASATMYVQGYSDHTTYESALVQYNTGYRDISSYWQAIEDDGTNVYIKFSQNGVDWVTIWSSPKTSGYLANDYSRGAITVGYNTSSSAPGGVSITVRCWDEDGLNRSLPDIFAPGMTIDDNGWKILGDWNYDTDGAVDSIVVPLDGIDEIRIHATDVTKAAAGWIGCDFSYDGGLTWKMDTLDFSKAWPTSGDIGASGSGTDYRWYIHGTAATAARSAFGQALLLSQPGAKLLRSARTATEVCLNRNVPTHIRVAAILTATTNTTFTGGTIKILGMPLAKNATTNATPTFGGEWTNCSINSSAVTVHGQSWYKCDADFTPSAGDTYEFEAYVFKNYDNDCGILASTGDSGLSIINQSDGNLVTYSYTGVTNTALGGAGTSGWVDCTGTHFAKMRIFYQDATKSMISATIDERSPITNSNVSASYNYLSASSIYIKTTDITKCSVRYRKL